MSQISIEGMEFYAYHGCFEEERKIGTRFIVDLFMNVDTTQAEEDDDLSKTVNYADVYETVKREMEQPSKLLENVARRALNAVKSKYQGVESARIKIRKMNPPLGGKMLCVAIELEG
jgi:dihydroneopterin aldolase